MGNKSFFFIVTILISLSFFHSCEKDESSDSETEPPTEETQYALGWIGEDDIETIPSSTNFGFGSNNLPTSVNLVSKFPPVGDQGNYGTCVSWAVAYNLKTALNGMSKGLSSSQLYSSANQFSPKDLFIAIPDNQKGQNCSGTNFLDALEILQNRGVASMQTVPYSSLGDCSNSNLQSSWTNEASQNKIKYWRKIEGSIQSIKQNLSNNIPVVLGAKLSDNFMSWNSNSVISSSTSFNNVGQHAYHAMIIAGYDDNKGPNGAFKVINSWGEFWGDNGHIWVDYNYMINEFCTSYNGDKPLFIAADDEENNTPPDQTDPIVTGVDLAPWIFSDFSNYQNSGVASERMIDFNIYNIGNQNASPTADWVFYYIYFNAYNANDYGVIFYDNFNTTIPSNSYYCATNYNCIFNYTITPGNSFANTIFGKQSQSRTYYMPQISGYYYLVLIADASDQFAEQDELNNLFYTTLIPKYFENGYGSRPEKSKSKQESISAYEFDNTSVLSTNQLKKSSFNTIISDNFKNAYTQDEILKFIKEEHKNGKLREKINLYKNQFNNSAYND